MRDLREKAGLTQQNVAFIIDVRPATISDWERGARQPRLPLAKVRQLIKLYNCTFEELADALEATTESEQEHRQQPIAV